MSHTTEENELAQRRQNMFTALGRPLATNAFEKNSHIEMADFMKIYEMVRDDPHLREEFHANLFDLERKVLQRAQGIEKFLLLPYKEMS